MTLPWYEALFYACNYGVVAAWLLLALAPRWSGTQRLVHSAAIPLAFGLAYALILFTDRAGNPEGSFLTLDGVVAIFESRQTVAAAWIHYLIFDLFVGAWEVRDSQRLRIPHLAVVPCLFGTLMFGPVGLLAYLTLRYALRRRAAFEETAPGATQDAGGTETRGSA